MKLHVASRGVTINFSFPAGGGGGGHVKIVTIKSLKIFLSRFARSVFVNRLLIFSKAGH